MNRHWGFYFYVVCFTLIGAAAGYEAGRYGCAGLIQEDARRKSLLNFPVATCIRDPEGIMIGENSWVTICRDGDVFVRGKKIGHDKEMRDRLFKVFQDWKNRGFDEERK